MHIKPLLLEACIGGAFGSVQTIDETNIYEAGFIYTDGEPFANAIEYLKEHWQYRMFVPLSVGWDKLFCDAKLPALTRTILKINLADMDKEKLESFTMIPKGYRLSRFDREAFEKHPFHHGSNYKVYEDFEERGSGAVVWHDGEIVASASSFLTYNNAVELDISTLPEHRRRGLALAACSAMLLDCEKRGIEVDWDAQNDASRLLAEKLGYTTMENYVAYCFVEPGLP